MNAWPVIRQKAAAFFFIILHGVFKKLPYKPLNFRQIKKTKFQGLAAFALWFCCFFAADAQVLPGQISDEEDNPLKGAWVAWPGSADKIQTNERGEFRILKRDSTEVYLLAGCRGFQTDTFEIKGYDFAYIQLSLIAKETAEIHIVRKKQGSFIDAGQTIKTEVITQKELTKAACCDMAGCFETQGTVQPQTTNVLTNAKELRILGLSGVYNQILMDGLPFVQGLTYTYGISSVPASIIDKIFVAKGANSVLQGFESISGQINVVTRDAATEPRLYANAYINNFGEKHFNANYSGAIDTAGKWNSLLGIHIVQPAGKRDRDADGFLDLPRLSRYSVFNRWNYGKENEAGFFTHFSIRATQENRTGGQRDFNPADGKGSSRIYGQSLEYFQPEWISKTGYRFSAVHAVQLQASAFGQRQESWFGTLSYKANQQNLNGWIQHQWNLHEQHSLTWGASFRGQILNEKIRFSDTLPKRSFAGNYRTEMVVPGLFAEHKAAFFQEKLTWIAGIRLDRHQDFRTLVTPRTMLKYDIRPDHILRASAGTGWRQVNLLSENIMLQASSRDIIFEEPLQAEKALNWGSSYTWMIDRKHISGSISVDFFQTRFQNQFFPDVIREPGKAFIRNFKGTSISNSAQAEANLKLFDIIEAKLSYNYLEVYRVENKKREWLPFNPRHRVVAALSWRPLSDKFYADFNVHAYDEQRLPSTLSSSGNLNSAWSDPYAIFNGQLTFKHKSLEIYGGVENIFDFRQLRPIAGWENPFGPNFDTGSVWGPTRGREWYLGLRWRLAKSRKA